LQRRRGIRSLIPTGTLTESEELIQELPVDRLVPSPFQPRRSINEEALQELIESVKTHGILQPLVARRAGSEFQLIVGERRLQAARRAGLEKVPVILREATDREMLELALVENLQREDINAMEAAEGYRRLMDEFELTQEELGERVGKSRSAVANTLRLLRLPEAVQDSLRRREIDEGHGKALAGLEQERLVLRLWRRVVRRGLSVRETEAAAAKLAGRSVPRGTRPAGRALDPNLSAVQDQLTEKLGARTRLRPRVRGDGGIIEIEYADAEDLHRIFTAIVE
jgi:ParB family chromosome partitioning protein